MKHHFLTLMTGIALGAALFSGKTALASTGVMANPSTQAVYVDGQKVNMTAFSIGGNNFVKLRDVGKAVGFAVEYDAATNSIQIDSSAPYVEEAKPAASAVVTSNYGNSPASGAIPVPQTDAAPFVPKEGDTILCDDGTTYKVTNMSHNREFPGALPTATCDWNQFPAVELPRAETRHFKNAIGVDYLFVRNLHETRRMQYTLYNAIGSNSQTWKDGKLVLRGDGTPLARVQLSIPDGANYQTFWPWEADRLTRVFHSCPPGLYQMEAWDVYADGVFLYTEYKVCTK